MFHYEWKICKCFHIVHNSRLVEQTLLRRIWWSCTYFRTLPFYGREQRSFFTTNISSLCLDYFEFKIETRIIDIFPDEIMCSQNI